MDEFDQVQSIYQTYSDLVKEGKEDQAGEYLSGHLKELPQELQKKIVSQMLTQSIIDDAAESEILNEIQEAGLEAYEKLEEIEKTRQE